MLCPFPEMILKWCFYKWHYIINNVQIIHNWALLHENMSSWICSQLNQSSQLAGQLNQSSQLAGQMRMISAIWTNGLTR